MKLEVKSSIFDLQKACFLKCSFTPTKTAAKSLLRSVISANQLRIRNLSWSDAGATPELNPQELAAAILQIIDNPDAMKLFRRSYRDPWVVPENI